MSPPSEAEVSPDAAPVVEPLAWISRHAWGVLLAVGLALAAALAESVLRFPAVLGALILGLCWCSAGGHERIASGLTFCSKSLLRLGVALLGVRISLPQMEAVGWGGAATALVAVLMTLLAGISLGRFLRLEPRLSIVIAGATAICGASAALAISAVCARDRRDDGATAAIVGAVTLIGSGAMALYTLISQLAGLSPAAAGVFLGASLHEVAQAVGAGYALSPTSGDVSTVVKMVRVACLAPVVVLVGLWFRPGPGVAAGFFHYVPPFLLAFVALAVASSLGAISEELVAGVGHASRLLLLVAIAALGARIAPRQVLAMGYRPFLLLCALTLLIAVISAGGALISESR